jgi:histidyl-tRNA synthetase
MEIPYNINKCLVRGLSYYTRTVIEIMQEDKETGKKVTITAGGRYDYLGKQLGSKKDLPAVGISIGVDRVVESPWFAKLAPRIIKKPKIYFIQLGFDAKLKSLNVIEILRKGKIPIAQSISKDNLGAQLAIAEKLGMEYAIIFGQKEAMENSVIFRDMSNRSQETVKLPKLLEYIKNIK